MDHKRVNRWRLFGILAILVTAFTTQSQLAFAQDSQLGASTHSQDSHSLVGSSFFVIVLLTCSCGAQTSNDSFYSSSGLHLPELADLPDAPGMTSLSQLADPPSAQQRAQPVQGTATIFGTVLDSTGALVP